MATMRPVDIVAWIFFAVLLKDSDCQVYSWSVSVPLNISVCSNSLSNPLTLDWTYTPATPDPFSIVWSKQATGSTFDTVATYASSTFTASAAYAGRVSRTGSTAEIAIQGPLTAADGGVYQVTVNDSTGSSLASFANVFFPAVNGPINASCVQYPVNVYTVNCSVDVTPPVTLKLKNGTVDLDSASSASGLSKTLSDAHTQTFQCSVTGEGSECVTPNSADVTCISGHIWSVSVPLNISVCSNSLSNPLTLDWTYTPSTPDPQIVWAKQGSDSRFNLIANFKGSTFTPNEAYAGRVSRAGSTAEIAIQGPLTAADGGWYGVVITARLGGSIAAYANVTFQAVNGPISASCVETTANVYTVTCSVDVTPPVTLQLKNGTVDLDSASSASGLSKTLSDAHTQTFQCSVTGEGSECVTPNSADVTCISAALVPVPEACGFALIAVIILVVLLVIKIASDVIFVAYRWGDRWKYILYWICFTQGIIHSICGVTFFIVIFATCSESLGDGLPIAVIVIGIIVGGIGVINIVMCLCCCCCPQSSNPGKPGTCGMCAKPDDPSPWLCCCCPPKAIHPGDKR